MMADRTAEGLHEGFQALIVAATPATCGQAMEVPDTRLNDEGFRPAGTSDDPFVGIHDASMFTPGAATSGFRMLPVCEEGPLDEK